ncbi:DNA repair protein rad8 [Zymoseptoria brevis]|uniref:DNA repair protein rad8 n=1 Tax=Zymoseptoria brevis TaxID=1047168 RepID=A0A0F4GIW1_9PEZI|nr:DNA repair protein rad8 [Zymoseptoria brevis]
MSILRYFGLSSLYQGGSNGEDDENIAVAQPARVPSNNTRKRKASGPVKPSRISSAHVTVTPTSAVLRELSDAEFNSLTNGRIAFVDLQRSSSKRQKTHLKPPNQAYHFATSATSKVPRDAPTPPRADSHSPPLDPRPVNGGRPRRSAAARQSYALEVPSSSEDELSAPASIRRKPAVRRKAAANTNKKRHISDDDFGASDDHDTMSDSEPETDNMVRTDENESTEFESDGSSTSAKNAAPKGKARLTAVAPTATKSKSSRTKATRVGMTNLLARVTDREINLNLAPRSAIDDIFLDMTNKAISRGLGQAVAAIGGRPLRVATMCSGTESPLLALEMIRDCLTLISPDLKLHVEHLFSAEIVPFKQAYIERNFNPPVIFRDITELTSVVHEESPEATTAYGGMMAVPKEVDMVIAGTSCVDFSGLNNRQKGLEDGGESADTWDAVLSYCRAFRPAIVLLENVLGANWDKMLEDYEGLNYECSGATVDTRSYYIPQVRQRGYMACFNKDAPGFTEGAAKRWVANMTAFQRAASSPVSAFLQPNDQIIRQQIRNDEPSREVDWTQCAVTQSEYRQEKRLGYARPITHWSESGSMLPPDHGHQAWFQKQVERVLDTIDGAVLRKALPPAMYDARYKSRIFDLSQNIYRETDHRPFGVAGCVTPSGMYFVTDLCRVLTSEEMLKLQGIPLSKISFTTETQAEIQDLAGNAMSSTVIGSSILSSVIAGYGALGHDANMVTSDPPTRKVEPTPRRVLRVRAHRVDGPSHAVLDIQALLRIAASSMRRCHCETQCGIAEKPIQQCTDCGHTTCTSCGGNPVHSYTQQNKADRDLPATFEDHVRCAMPLRLRLTHLAAAQTGDAAYDKAFKHATEGTFSFQRVRRTHCWTISYRSTAAVLELVIADGHSAEWRFYAVPDKELPGNSKLRRVLQQPIAKSTVASTIFPAEWKCRIPKKTSCNVSVVGSGRQIASWWSRNEMPDFVDHRVWEFLTIKSDDKLVSRLTGEYQYLPRCGKACDSLYKKVGSNEPIFLFLDPTQTGDPDEDSFVFSTNIAMLEQDEVRPILGRIAAPWRPWTNSGDLALTASATAQIVFDESWKPSRGLLNIVENQNEILMADASSLHAIPSCGTLAVLLSCSLPVHDVDRAIFRGQSFFSPKHAAFFDAHAWIFEEMRRHLKAIEGDWMDIINNVHDRCLACAPERPELKWAWADNGTDLRPHEDVKSAALYERRIKARPEPVSVIVDDVQTSTWCTFSLGVDAITLAHRAGARLSANISANNLDPISYSWRFVTTPPESFNFKPFKISDTRGLAPYPGKLELTINLFPKQLMSLAWMRQQEEGVPFRIDETEEAVIPTLGWRAEARAQTELIVRGGICADHPGFGKTITSLALIDAEFLDHQQDALRKGLEKNADGLLTTAATLIICQASLVQQWVDEIQDKLPSYKGLVLAIKTQGDLSKRTTSGFEKARIVVVSNAVLINPSYIDRLAAFGAVPPPFTLTSSRQLAQWLRFATKQIPDHLKILKIQGLPALRKHIKSKYAERIKDSEFNSYVPSKRLKGQAYVDGKAKKRSAAPSVANDTICTDSVEGPLLQQFYWNRIIVDEFHQNDPKISAVINSLKADKRWGLSATPQLEDFYELAQIGALLNVPLPLGSDSRGLMKKSSVRELRKDMTSFELFDAMRQTPTHSMHHRIHEMDQKFLDTFVRRNLMAVDEFPIQQHLVPVTLDLDHRALFAELCQHLNSLAMKIRKGKGASDREVRFREAVSSSSTAEEALSKVAAYSDRSTIKSRDLGLQSIVNDRVAKYKNILKNQIPTAVARAKGTEPDNFAKWLERIQDGALGDRDLTNTVLPIAKREEGVKVKKSAVATINEDGNKVKAQGARALTADLNSKCEQLLVEKRSARYIENLLDVSTSDKPQLLCNRDDCNRKCSKVAVSALCGHKVCHDCYKDMKAHEIIKCPGEGCSAPMMDFHLLWPGQQLSTITKYGGKIEAALKLLAKIQQKDEQAVLFVQFANQLDEVEYALNETDISAVVVKTTVQAGDQIKDFRESAGKKKKTVIVLNASDETAAGINLQNANHVIFLSPLLRETQYGYDSTMAQAIGRVRRHGQTREIHVYRIFAIHTVDVDILERSEKRFDALTEQGAKEIQPPKGGVRLNEFGEPRPERTQLVLENGKFSLRPQSWLIAKGKGKDGDVDVERVKVKNRVSGWEDFSSLVKFSKTFMEDDED